jgi:hypothetical protein
MDCGYVHRSHLPESQKVSVMRLRLLLPFIVAIFPLYLGAQRRGATPNTPAASGRAMAPFDITGYWVALITDDWRYRMLTPPKGNVDYLPVNAEGRRVADMWDPAKDEANDEQCKAYGAAGVMRLPGRLRISWLDDNTLQIETESGRQTRRLVFGASQPSAVAPSWQGYSAARWDFPPGRGQAPSTPGFGQLRVVTTHLRAGYLRKNGVPYSANAVLTEYFVRLVDRRGQEYLALTQMVDDPQYLQQPYIKTYEYKKQPDASGWNPTACSAK